MTHMWHICGISVNRELWHLEFMAKDDVYFKTRLPKRLKANLDAACVANSRSLTAEIRERLEASFLIVNPETYPGASPELIGLIRTIVYETLSIIDERKSDATTMPHGPD